MQAAPRSLEQACESLLMAASRLSATAMLLLFLLALPAWAQERAPEPDSGATSSNIRRDLRAVTIVTWGDSASLNLARSYAFLATKYPDLLRSEDPQDVVVAADEIPWRAAIRLRKWPPTANQELLFMETFRVRNAKTATYHFPDATAVTGVTSDTIQWPWNANFPYGDQVAQLCDKVGWPEIRDLVRKPKKQVDSGELDWQCVRYLLPARSGSGSGQASVQRPAYFLWPNKHVSNELAEKISSGLKKYVRQLDDVDGGEKIRVLRGDVGRPEPQQISGSTHPPDWCSEAIIASQRSRIQWNDSEAIDASSVAIVDSTVRRRMGGVGDDQFATELQHPYVTAMQKDGTTLKELKAQCNQIVAVPDTASGVDGYHALAVASVAYGVKTIFLRPASTVGIKAHGFLSPNHSDLNYLPARDLRGPDVWPMTMHQAHAVIAPFDGEILSQDEMQEAAHYAKDIAAAGGVVVVSAPKRSGCNENVAVSGPQSSRPAPPAPNRGLDFPPYDYSKAGKLLPTSVCNKWPVCLGAIPQVVVVAALDNNDAILCESVAMLGSSVVSLAAPAEAVLTALPLSTGPPRFSLQSGSSFAAPAVAAVAMAMQSKHYGRRKDPLDILARIQATADLTFMPDKVRFGKLHARRALTGMEESNDSWDLVWDASQPTPPPPKQATIEAPKTSTSACASKNQPVEAVRARDANTLGFLRLFEPDTPYPRSSNRSPDCIPLKSVLRIVPSGFGPKYRDSRNNQLFTVVYFSKDYEYPIVRRNVALHPTSPNEPYGCSFSGDPQAPCLLIKYRNTGTFMPLDFSAADLVLSFDKRYQQRTCNGNNCGRIE